MKLECIRLGEKTKSISVSTGYEVINETDNRYTLINDNGVQKNYAKNLFRVIPEVPPVQIINELNIETSTITENNGSKFSVSCQFPGRNRFNYISENYLIWSRTEASCGIYSLTGLNNIILQLNRLRIHFNRYLENHNQVFILNEDIDLDETFKDIYTSIIQDLIAEFEGTENPKCAMFTLSTTVNDISQLPSLAEILEELSTSTIKAYNPNSGNNIISWTFLVNEFRNIEDLVEVNENAEHPAPALNF